MSWLKKRLEETLAQIIPFDGKTAATVRAARNKPAPAQTVRSFPKRQVDIGLDRGESWENIARNTGSSLEDVRRYSQQTRPNYGIKPSMDYLRDRAARNAQAKYRRGEIDTIEFNKNMANIYPEQKPKQNFFERNVLDRFSDSTAMDEYKRNQQFKRSQREFEQEIRKQAPLFLSTEAINKGTSQLLKERQSQYSKLKEIPRSGWVRNVFDANTPQDQLSRLAKGGPANYEESIGYAPGESRGALGQITHPLIGTVQKLPAQLTNAIGQTIGAGIQALPGDKDSQLDQWGRNVQDFYSKGNELYQNRVDTSRFSTQARRGEMSPLVNLSSGAGSLASSIAIAAATRSPGAAAAVFGANAAGEQIDAARQAGLSPWQQLATGGTAAVVEGGLERVGLSRLFKAAGANTLAKRALHGYITEALQEGSQSLGQKVVSDIYKDVDYAQAFKEAAMEAGYGGILGSASAVSLGSVQNMVNDPRVKGLTKQKIAEQIREKASLKPNKQRAAELQRQREQNIAKISKLLPTLDTAKLRGKTASVARIEKQIQSIEKDNASIDAELRGTGGFIRVGGASAKDGGVNNIDGAAEAMRPQQLQPTQQSLSEASSTNSVAESTGQKANSTETLTQQPAQNQEVLRQPSQSLSNAKNTIPPEQGAKKTWYHGTNTKFDKFDQSKIGSTTDDGIFGRGFYFSDDKDFAAQAPRGGAKHVMEVQPNIDNPLDLSNFKTKKELADYLGMSEQALYQQDEAGLIRPSYSQIRQFTSAAREKGHDGVLVPHSKFGGKGDELVVFDAEKIQVVTQPTKGAKTQATSSKEAASQLQPQSPELQGNAQDQSRLQGPAQTGVQSPANLPSTQTGALSSQDTPKIEVDNTTNSQDSKDWGSLMRQVDEEMASFNAVAGAKGTKNATKLVDAIKQDNAITEAAKKASRTGEELNFYAKNDANGRSVGVESFDPDSHRIEAGFVVDNKGNVLGNHIKVDNTGIQVNVGGELVNMESVLGNPNDWKGKYRVSETMSRNIDRNAPSKEIAQQTKDFLITSKFKAEAKYRTELEAEFKNLKDRINRTNKAKPRNVSKQQWEDDIFSVLNGDKTDADIKSKYDQNATKAILEYKKETRALYDSLLERINKERVKFGKAPVEGRKDYITHLTELAQNRSFTGEVYSSLRNSFVDEGMQKTRGAVPGQIAGRTENFKPDSAWNKYMQRRTGTKSLRDPFNAVQAYLEPALYNIHMTEATVRARSVEAAFRTAGELQAMQANDVLDTTKKVLEPYKNGGNSKLVAGFGEYANSLAKKTQRWDRQIVDASDASAMAVRGWQGLQRVGGRATILGNASSVLAQPLNQVVTLADAGPVNYMKGIAAKVGGNKAIEKSSFIKARRTQAVEPIRNKRQKVLDAGGVPLQAMEMAAVETTWHAMYAKARSNKLTGQRAIDQADLDTERLVAGRGIADRPEMYRSTVANGLLQYTLEVNAQYKTFMQDLNTQQKATFMVAALGMNSLMAAVTGFEPLPDFLGAAIDTGEDLLDEEDERGAGEKVLAGGKTMLGEFVGMNPVASAGANAFLTQQQRKSFFGEDSDLGRFEGTAAPVQVIKNAYNAASDLAEGNLTGARDNFLRTIPFGNQARKTILGAEANSRGYSVDRSGNPTYGAPDSIYGKAQNLLFGPSSTSNARNYYNQDQRSITGKDDLKQIEGANPADVNKVVDNIQERRLMERNKKATKTTGGSAGSVPSLDDDAYDIVRKALRTEKGKLTKVGDYDNAELIESIETVTNDLNGDLRALGLPEVRGRNTKIAKRYANFKNSENGSLESMVRDVYKQKPPLKEAEAEIKSWLPKNIDTPKITKEIASDWVNFKLAKASGELSRIDEDDKRKTLLRGVFNSQLSNIEKDIYKLSESRLESYVNNGTLTKQNVENALKVEKQLYDAGLIDKEPLARKLNLQARGYKTRKKSKSSGYKLLGYGGGVNPISITKSLAQLLEEATKFS